MLSLCESRSMFFILGVSLFLKVFLQAVVIGFDALLLANSRCKKM